MPPTLARLATWTLLALAATATVGPAGRAEQPDAGDRPAALRIDGESVWHLRFALGDADSIPGGSDLFASGVPTLEQQLRLRLEGDVAPGVTVSADLDNVRSDNLQLLGVDIRWAHGVLHLGDLQLRSQSRYAASPAALIGARVEAQWGDFSLTGLVGRARGIPATKTFVGQSSEEVVEWVIGGSGGERPPYAPSLGDGAVMVADARGAQGFRLNRPFDADFVRVWWVPVEEGMAPACGTSAPGVTLSQLLAEYRLDFLLYRPGQPAGQVGVLVPLSSGDEAREPPWLPPQEAGRTYFPLEAGQLVGLASPDAEAPGYVLLRLESMDLLRAHVEALIRRYNLQNGLSGPTQRQYPLVRGSTSEAQFLQRLRLHYLLWAGLGPHPGGDGWVAAADGPVSLDALGTCPHLRERLGLGASNEVDGSEPGGPEAPLYLLGRGEIDPTSLELQVRLPEGRLEPAEDRGIGWRLYAEEGVLQLRYPGQVAELLAPGGDLAALRVRYRYSVSQGVYFLGTSIAVGSERVYLDGALLQRNVDYLIDYELGILTLLREVGPASRLTVQFEYFRGGLGASAEYNRNMLGLEAQWAPAGDEGPWRLVGGLFVEADEPRPLVEPERARTMPNTHVVAALRGSYGASGPTGAEGSGQGWWGQWDLAWSYDRFPIDDNLRDHQANRVHAVTGSAEGDPSSGTAKAPLVMVGHGAGLTVLRLEPSGETTAHLYTTAHGLSGLTVRAIAPAVPGTISDGSDGASAFSSPPLAWLLATESGLTVVLNRPGEETPSLDLTANWLRRYTHHGLPSNDVHDVLYIGRQVTTPERMSGSVWVATSRGLAWAPATDLEAAAVLASVAADDVLTSWRSWESLPGSTEPLDLRDLAVVAGSGDEVPIILLAASSEGLLWLWWPDDPSAAEPTVHRMPLGPLRRVAGIVRPGEGEAPSTVRLFAGTDKGLLYVDVLATIAAGGRPNLQVLDGPHPVSGIAGAVHALQWQTEEDAAGGPSLWAATDAGLYRVDPGRPGQDEPASLAQGSFTAVGLGASPAGGSPTTLWAAGSPPVGGPSLWWMDRGTLGTFQVPAEELPAQDPARFQDPPTVRERTGMAGQVALGYGWGTGGVDLRYERVEPSFRAINDTRRQWLDGWEVTLRQRLTESLDVVLARSDRVSADPETGRAQRNVVERGEARWQLPLPAPATWASAPALRATLQRSRLDSDEARPGFEATTLTRGLRVEQRLWQERIVLAAGYEQVRHQEVRRAGYVSHNLVADLSAVLLPDTRLTVRFSYPLKVTEAHGGDPPRMEGSQQLQVGATAARSFGPVRTSVTLGQQSGWRVTGEGTSPERAGSQATLSVAAEEMTVAGWRLQPSGRLGYTRTDSARSQSTGLAVNGGLRARWAPAALEMALSADRQYQWAVLPSTKQTRQDRAELTLRSRAWSGIDPSLTLRVDDRRAVAVPDGWSTQTLQRSASVRVGWAQASWWPQELRLSAGTTASTQPPADSRRVGAAYVLTLRPGGPWELATTLEGEGGDATRSGQARQPHWRISVQGRLDHRLSGQWSGTLALGHARGVRDPLSSITGSVGYLEPRPFAVSWAELSVRARF
ncbi:hypothetical protein [Geochorda subterranea]|uniref:PA14 domain-containing protein n=1 Tax=Geochorda subterranea TaxID=3109564 RepID=A0ABZ1BSN3_9FIRM|nr:hypothetical protein [Limnochorda sp. LNt]WRP15623.1 hypothetical protein VLY81_05525 [Limnochorda sp. LNt]